MSRILTFNLSLILQLTSSEGDIRRSLSIGGVIARSPRRLDGGVFSLSIVFHI